MGALLKGGFLFALWIMPIASTAHSQEINIDCEKLGTTLESFLVFKAIDAAGKPISPDHTKGISHNDLRQRASDGHIKRLEPALTEDEVYSCFGNQGRELLFLKNSTDNQRLRFRTTKIWNTFYLFWGQVVLIALGAIATILLAFGNSPRWGDHQEYCHRSDCTRDSDFLVYRLSGLSRGNHESCQSRKRFI